MVAYRLQSGFAGAAEAVVHAVPMSIAPIIRAETFMDVLPIASRN
jgi:hypothetical protein